MLTRIRDRGAACGAPWLIALAAGILALLTPAARADLSTNSHWPMFRHEAAHSGRAAVSGPNAAALRWRQVTGGSVNSSPAVFNDPGARKIWNFHGETWPGRATPIPATPADARPGLTPANPSPVPDFQALRSIAPDASLRALASPVAAGAQVRLGIFETSAANAGQNNFDPDRESIPAGTWRFKFWARSRLAADPTQPGQVRLFFKVFKFQQPLIGSPDAPDDLLQRAGLQLFDTVDEFAATTTDLAQFTIEKDVAAITLDNRIIGSQTFWGVRVEVWASNPTANDALVRFDYEGNHSSRVETPAVDPCVYVGSDDGSLYAMNTATGDIHWSFANGQASQLLYLRFAPWAEFAAIPPPSAADSHMLASATPAVARFVNFSWDTGTLGPLPAAITANSQARGWASDVWPNGAALAGGTWRLQVAFQNTTSGSGGTLFYRVLTAAFDGTNLVLSRVLRDWTQGPALAVAAVNTVGTMQFDTAPVPATTLNGSERLYIEIVSIPGVPGDAWQLEVDTIRDTVHLPPRDRMRSSPAIDDEGVAYIGAELGPDFNQGRLYAVNNDGTLKWLYPTDPETVFFHPVAGSNWGALNFSDAGNAVPQVAQAQTGAGANVFVQWRADSNAPNPPNAVVEPAPSQPLTAFGWLSSPTQVGLSGRTLTAGSWRFLLNYAVTNTATLPTAFLHYRISKVSLAPGPTRVEELLGWTRFAHPTTGVIKPAAANTVYSLDITTPEVSGATFNAGEFIYVEFYIQQVSPGDAGATWVLSDSGGAGPRPPQLDTAGFERVSPVERLFLRALGQPAAATVPTTAQLTRTPGQAENMATSVLTVASSSDFYQFQPGVSDNSTFVNLLPAAITQFGWIAEEPRLAGQQLAAGSWRLRLRYDVSDTVGSPQATLWYRVSQVAIDTAPQIVRVRELLGWTASPSLAPTAASPAFNEILIDTPQVAAAALGLSEFLYVEYFLQPTVAVTSSRRWALHVETDATWVLSADVLTSPVAGIVSSPAVAADDASTILFADRGGRVYGVDREGRDRWDPPVELPNLPDVTSSPAIAPKGSPQAGTIYVADLDGFVTALDKDTGATKWRFPAANPVAAIHSSPLVGADGRIFFATERSFDGLQNGQLVALDANGNLLWAFTPTNPRAAPLVDDIQGSVALSFDGTTLYVGSDDGNLYAINAADGSPKWNYVAGLWDATVPATRRYPMRSSPAIAPGLKLLFHDDPAGSDGTQLLSSAAAGANTRTAIASNLPADTIDNPVHTWETRAVTLTGGTSSGDPDVATLPAGVWSFVIKAKVVPSLAAPGETASLKFRVSWVDGGSLIPTLVFVSSSQTLTTAFTRYTLTGVNPTSVQLNLTNLSFLWVEALADTTGNTQPLGVQIQFDGDTGSRVQEPDLIFFGADDGRIYGLTDSGAAGLNVFVNDDNGNGALNDPSDTGGWDPNWNPLAPGPDAPFRSSPAVSVAPYFKGATGQAARSVGMLYIGSLDWQVYAVGLGPQGALSAGGGGGTGGWAGSEIRLRKSASPNVVCGGSAANPPDKRVTYTIRVENIGVAAPKFGLTGAAANITVNDALPYGVTVVPGSITPPGQQVGNSVVWDLNTAAPPVVLLPGGGVTLKYTAEVIPTFNGTDPDPQPVVAVGTSAPDPDSAQPSDGPKPFNWGDYVYLWLKGRGAPSFLSNRAEAAWTETDTNLAGLRQSNEVVVKVGWSNRYKVTLSYGPTTDPDAVNPPNNQAGVTLTMDLTRSAATKQSGAAMEIYDSGEPGRITITKMRVSPYATGQDISQPPNRPWTPYYWKAVIQQATCPAQGPWSAPWERLDSGSPSVYDILVHNPLAVAPTVLQLRSGALHNPGSNTGWDVFDVTNTSHHSLSSGGVVVQSARNVVRWQTVDLGQTNAGSPGLSLALPNYQPRLENYLPEHLLNFSPSDALSLGAGQTGTVQLWGEIPRYLSPGAYGAPSAVAPATPMRIYADLNGNGAWDPGEARFEDEQGGTYNEFAFSIGVASEPSLHAGYETTDIGKGATGSTPAAAYPGGAIENRGNLALPAVTVNPLDASGYLPLERSDLQLSLRRPGETTPLWWNLGGFSVAMPKTPVRAASPLAGSLNLSPTLSEGQPAGAGPGLPSGSYIGLPDFTATVTDPIGGGSLIANASSRLAVRATETRLTSELGADVTPSAAFTTADTLMLFWSSNRLAGGGAPSASDPYSLYYQTLTRDRAATPWSTSWSTLGGPYPSAGDPLSTPAGAVTRGHMSPGFGLDLSGTQWLYWGAWALRSGPKYDARLLWTDWTAGGASILDLPPVSVQGEAAMTGAFKAHPAPLGWTFTYVEPSGLKQHEYNLRAVWSEGGGSNWQLMLSADHRLSTRASITDPWTPDPAGWVAGVIPISVSRDLSDVRDPVAFADPTGSGLVDLVFTARSGQEGNHDIYHARYNPALLGDKLTYGEAPFAVLTDRLSPHDPANATFVGRHRRWAESLYSVGTAYVANGAATVTGVGTSWSAGLVAGDRIRFGADTASYIIASVDSDTQVTLAAPYAGASIAAPGAGYAIGPVRIYVCSADQAPSPGAEIGGAASPFDATAGRYLISGTRYGTVEVYPDLGLVNFRQSQPANGLAVTVAYAPRLMRLTTSARDDLTPAAFVETYRYLDGSNQPQPAGFIPRLWVFSTRSGGEGSAPRIYLQTFRRQTDASGNLGWVPETRNNWPYWSTDVSETIIPLEHAANEFGLTAVKDPVLAQVWLFWSSTRSLSAGAGVPPTQNADIYTMTLNPALPE